MTRPVVHAGVEQIYRLLPDFMRDADLDSDFLTLRYLAGAGVPTVKAVEMLTIADANTSVTGTCEMANPQAIPRAYLRWLGWLVGIDTGSLAESDIRSAIGDAAVTQRRGSLSALRTVIARTLTGSKSMRIYVNPSGTDPYRITVITQTDQTPDEAATLAAAMSEKPAGMRLTLTVIDGGTYGDVFANHTDYTDIDATFADYIALNQWDPPTP